MRLFLGKEYHDHDLVFCQDDGEPLHPDTPSKWFPKYLAKIGLSPINFHCLRHSHASLLINAGAEPKTISERLGHSSIRVTYDVYGHLFAGRQTEALEKMSDLLRDKKAQKRHKNEKGSQE